MNTLREAVHEYLSMRRHLGFQLRAAERGLLDFVTFMEQHQVPFITQALALAWAQQPSNVQPSQWAVNGGGIMVHARRPVGPVAAAQKCATDVPLSVVARGGGCTAWSSMQRYGLRLSRKV